MDHTKFMEGCVDPQYSPETGGFVILYSTKIHQVTGVFELFEDCGRKGVVPVLDNILKFITRPLNHPSFLKEEQEMLNNKCTNTLLFPFLCIFYGQILLI